jgi:two-component system sensor histidine kinase KdpD
MGAETSGEGILVEVADHGPGIVIGEEQRIFDKFHRAGASAESRGAGLGLTICRGIVEAHGGRIWAENRAGDGTEPGGALLRFTLPTRGTPPPPPESESESESEPASR